MGKMYTVEKFVGGSIARSSSTISDEADCHLTALD